jgi:recombination protein RecR
MKALYRLSAELAKLPGIGPKSAFRLAMTIARRPAAQAEALAHALVETVHTLTECSRCHNFTDVSPCTLCVNPKRDPETLCVIEDVMDLFAIEKSGSFRGLYHVLHGALSPLDGIGPDQLRLNDLVLRIKKEEIKEVVVATNPNVTGDATALYIARLLQGLPLKLSRLASGLPVGSSLEYMDAVTLSRAIEQRLPYQ